MKHKSLSPLLLKNSNSRVHHHFFACPACHAEVGGFVITGQGEDDWSTHTDKFCSECGQPIDWSKTNWFDIYKNFGEESYER
ncbi:MAG: hypothetical protein IIW69_03445 [Bacteroidaceae bacterium]|nr:hypothetical protein [Bacteroidaceae bacterium]